MHVSNRLHGDQFKGKRKKKTPLGGGSFEAGVPPETRSSSPAVSSSACFVSSRICLLVVIMPTPFDLRLSDRRSPNLTHIRLHGCDNHHRFAVLLGSGGSFAEGTYALQQTIFTSCNDYSITSSARGEQLRRVSMPSAVAVDVAVGVDAGKHRGPWPHIHVFIP